MKHIDYTVLDINLAAEGEKKLQQTMGKMPVLQIIDGRLSVQRPLANVRIAACCHVAKETGAACIALKNAGADIMLVASNPLSTQDDVAAALVKYYNILVYAHSRETNEECFSYRKKLLSSNPNLLLDDGAEAVSQMYEYSPESAERLIGSVEQTTSGFLKSSIWKDAGC